MAFDYFRADILRQRTKDVEVKKYCIHLLEKLGSFEYTRTTLKQLDAEARAEVRVTHEYYSLWRCLKHIFFLCRLNILDQTNS